ncbi:YtxH domain-containing protein [Priestia megaterium]|nr:YtxH domain-containing protein [Priestia megaterium]
MTQATTSNKNMGREQNGKLLKGIAIGAVVGGAVAMLDSKTRNKVTSATKDMKDSTMDMVAKVKENPSEVKNDWQERINTATTILKEAINDAQNLYQKVNNDFSGQVHHIKEESSEILSSAKEVKEDAKEIGSKVKQAGEEVASESTSTGTSAAASSIDTPQTKNPNHEMPRTIR